MASSCLHCAVCFLLAQACFKTSSNLSCVVLQGDAGPPGPAGSSVCMSHTLTNTAGLGQSSVRWCVSTCARGKLSLLFFSTINDCCRCSPFLIVQNWWWIYWRLVGRAQGRVLRCSAIRWAVKHLALAVGREVKSTGEHTRCHITGVFTLNYGAQSKDRRSQSANRPDGVSRMMQTVDGNAFILS